MRALLLIVCVLLLSAGGANFVTYNTNSGIVIFISGIIQAVDGRRLEKRVLNIQKNNKKVLGVSFNSEGGSLRGGVALGKILHKYKLTTIVGVQHIAHSAAGIAVLMSNKVIIQYSPKTGETGIIGLHRPYIVNPDKSITQISDKEVNKLVNICIAYGVKPSIARMMTLTPPTQMSEITAYNAFIFDHTIKVRK